MGYDYRKAPVTLRPGKTARDKGAVSRMSRVFVDGAWQWVETKAWSSWGNRFANAKARAEWDHAMVAGGAKRGSSIRFPLEVCNGRDSRDLRASGARVKKDKGSSAITPKRA